MEEVLTRVLMSFFQLHVAHGYYMNTLLFIGINGSTDL